MLMIGLLRCLWTGLVFDWLISCSVDRLQIGLDGAKLTNCILANT